ncbi:MAG: DUF882 domain-containing protein [Xanthomonadales bacterium]|nr:DUF882 domain-containing protein [Xanthomonadales bacterium]
MRRLLGLLTGLALFISTSEMAGMSAQERTLRFYHTHTRQKLEVTYFRDGDYLPGALDELCAFLADWRNGEQTDLDPELFDLLWDIQRESGTWSTFEVISAYRSEATNEMLRQRSSGVAKKSQHLLGKGIDVRLRGLELERLRDTAKALQRGGVGYYASSNFVHVDTGRVRYW